jgi:hypothetical protein
MAARAWGLQGWAQSAAGVMGLAVQGWMYQVRHRTSSKLQILRIIAAEQASLGRLPWRPTPWCQHLVHVVQGQSLWACRGLAAAAQVAKELKKCAHSTTLRSTTLHDSC